MLLLQILWCEHWGCTWHAYVIMCDALCSCLCMSLSVGLIPTIWAYNTCIWSPGINFLLVKFYLHLPRVCTHRDECKSCRRRGDTALGFAAGADSFSPISPPPPSLCFFVSSFLCFFSTSLSLPVKGKRWHLGCCPASTVSSFFYFSRGGGIENKRDRAKRKAKSVLPPSSLFSYIDLLPSPLSSHWPWYFPLFSF